MEGPCDRNPLPAQAGTADPVYRKGKQCFVSANPATIPVVMAFRDKLNLQHDIRTSVNTQSSSIKRLICCPVKQVITLPHLPTAKCHSLITAVAQSSYSGAESRAAHTTGLVWRPASRRHATGFASTGVPRAPDGLPSRWAGAREALPAGWVTLVSTPGNTRPLRWVNEAQIWSESPPPARLAWALTIHKQVLALSWAFWAPLGIAASVLHSIPPPPAPSLGARDHPSLATGTVWTARHDPRQPLCCCIFNPPV